MSWNNIGDLKSSISEFFLRTRKQVPDDLYLAVPVPTTVERRLSQEDPDRSITDVDLATVGNPRGSAGQRQLENTSSQYDPISSGKAGMDGCICAKLKLS